MPKPFHLNEASDYAQHLTWRTRNREPFLEDEVIAERCLIAFEKERPRLHAPIYAYVLMPDHVHIVVGAGPLPPGAIVQWLKLASTFWLKKDGLIESTLWARGYWDRAVKDTYQLAAVIRYLHNNPVKAGLVDNIGDYQFSSFKYYEGSGTSLLLVTSELLY